MSDTYSLNTNNLFIQTLVEKWMESEKVVDELDEKMDVESYGKTKLLNGAFNNVGALDDEKNPLAKFVHEFMKSEAVSTDEQFAGFYETIRKIIKPYEVRLNSYVKDNTKTIPDSEKPKPEEIEEMRKERKVAVDAMNGIRGLLEATEKTWFEDTGKDLMRVMENKRGAVGKRGELGPRLAGKYQFKVNGTILSDNKMSAIVVFLKSKVSSVKEVRDAIKAQIPNFDFENPPQEFAFNIAGAHVQAERLVDDSPDESDDEDDEIDDIVTETSTVSADEEFFTDDVAPSGEVNDDEDDIDPDPND